MAFKLSRMQHKTLETLRPFGEQGATIYDLEEALDLSKASIYKHLEALYAHNAILKVYRLGDKKAYYVAGGSASMPMLPPMGDVIPSIPASSFLAQWRFATDINEWSFLREARKFPYLLGKLAQFGWRMTSTEPNDLPEESEISELRAALTNIARRAEHLMRMCDSLLLNESLWDAKRARTAWYNDKSVYFEPATANAALKHIEDLMEQYTASIKPAAAVAPD